MPNVNVLNIRGEVVSSLALPDDVFADSSYDHLLHEVVRFGQAARQQGTHAAKNRYAVRGGGKKMWKQKGTGRARHGGSRAPQMRGGGVAHPPRPRSHAFKLNKKVRRAALKSAIARRTADSHLLVFENLDFGAIKTRPVVQLLERLGVGSALVVLPERDDTVERSARNIPHVKVLAEAGLNVEDVLRHEHLILTTATVDRIAQRFAP